MFRPRFLRTAIATALLALTSLHAMAGEAPAPPVAPVAPEAPAAPRYRALSPDLDGHVERSVMQSLEGLQGLESLADLRHLDRLAELEALADEAHVDAMVAAADAEAHSARYAERYDSNDSNGAVIDQKRSLKSNGRVYVNNVAGIIDVSVWDRNEVAIGGRLGSTQETLEISGDSNELNVVVKAAEEIAQQLRHGAGAEGAPQRPR